MPTLNEETGNYMGDIVERDGELYATGCVPTAVANYLHLHKTPKDTIENILKDLMKSPEAKRAGQGGVVFDTGVMPEVIERTLRTHIAKNIHVTLYGNFSDYEDIPNEKQSHIKFLPAGDILPSGPFIAVTELEGINHFWVAAGNPLERIDSDGKVHESLRPVGGYLEIRGL